MAWGAASCCAGEGERESRDDALGPTDCGVPTPTEKRRPTWGRRPMRTRNSCAPKWGVPSPSRLSVGGHSAVDTIVHCAHARGHRVLSLAQTRALEPDSATASESDAVRPCHPRASADFIVCAHPDLQPPGRLVFLSVWHCRRRCHLRLGSVLVSGHGRTGHFSRMLPQHDESLPRGSRTG